MGAGCVQEIRRAYKRIQPIPLRVIEDVEGLRSELQVDLLRRLEDLVQRHVEMADYYLETELVIRKSTTIAAAR